MATVKSLMRKLQALNTNEVVQDSFVRTADDFAEENKKQLFDGFKKNGQQMKQYANADYAFYKANLNPLPGLGNPDLKLTGAFYQGIKTTVSGDVIVTNSSDEKNEDLKKKYGVIFGLGGPFKKEFIDKHLRPVFRKSIKEKIGL